MSDDLSLREKALSGDPEAAFRLGQKLTLYDAARAQRYFERAARSGHGPAKSTLANLLLRGDAAEPSEADRERARTLITEAVAAGERSAWCPLAALWLSGSEADEESRVVMAVACVLMGVWLGDPSATSVVSTMRDELSLETWEQGRNQFLQIAQEYSALECGEPD